MLEIIRKALKEEGVKSYSVKKIDAESAELFFIKNKLDMSRAKKTTEYKVTVYVDLGETRGSSTAEIGAKESYEEAIEKIKNACESAKNAQNPYYELPPAETYEEIEPENTLTASALGLAKATYAVKSEKAFVNTLEIFATRTHIKMISSTGLDVSFWKQSVNGEFVAQCKEPEDVEIYKAFNYAEVDEKAHSAIVYETLKNAEARATARGSLKTGEYDLIVDDENLANLIGEFYLSRTNVGPVYAGYADLKLGDDFQPEALGEKINLTLKARYPFDGEGVRLKDRLLIEDGKIKSYNGASRYCYYLGIPPVGNFESFSLENGKTSLEELTKKKCVYVKVFSDLQVDAFAGVFGGEIRLGYLYEDGKVTAFTGGSISGSWLEAQKNLAFSKERYSSYSYEGPKAAKILKVTFAGE